MSASMTKKIQTQALSASMKIEEETMLMQKQGIVTILGSDCDTNTAPFSSLQRTLSADMSSKKWLSQNGSFPMKKIASSEELFHPKTIADSLSYSSSSSSEGEDTYEEAKDHEAKDEADTDAEAERERLEIWSSIQRNKKEEQEKAGPFDMWSSIISLKNNKDEISKSLPVTPYVHPLVKRSKSSLNEKSLEICTESLGSETGSDGLFSSYPSSETGDAGEDKEVEQQHQQQEKVIDATHEPEVELQVPRYNHVATTKKSSPRSFPPPLPILSSRQAAWPSLQMRSHRDNGRLVLEAVSVPSHSNFCVQRQEGRLVLTFANHYDHEEQEEDADEVAEKEVNDGVEELEEEFGEFEEGDYDDQHEKEREEGEDVDEDGDETEEEEEVWESESESYVRDEKESVIEKAPLLSGEISTTSAHRLTLVMNKPIGLVNRNPKWSEKFNEVVNFDDVNVGEPSPVAKSLPPRPRVARLIPSAPGVGSAAAAAASFNSNAYEYYWRTKSTAKVAPDCNTLAHQENNDSSLKNNHSNKLIVSRDTNRFSNEQQQFLVLRRKNGDYLVQNWNSCKDSRRSFLFWEPYCIATS